MEWTKSILKKGQMPVFDVNPDVERIYAWANGGIVRLEGDRFLIPIIEASDNKTIQIKQALEVSVMPLDNKIETIHVQYEDEKSVQGFAILLKKKIK